MSEDIILKVENLSKQYKLGTWGTGTLSHDLNRWWHKIRGKPDPYLKIGETNDRATKGNSEYVWALKDINFEVKRGEVLGIIGANGAGKSTLLKILSKVTLPTTGQVISKGRIASLLEVGTGFHPEMTGRENIYLNGAILGMTKKEIDRKFDEIVEFAGVARYVDTPVKRYSSGMKVRLAFAVAAHLEPEILVVDEVLAVGDAEFQKKAIGKMQDISKADGRTVLFVSHDMAAIKNLCTNLIVLKNGKISYKGKVDEGINHYLQRSLNYSYNIKLDNLKRASGNNSAKFINLKFSSIFENKFYENRILSGGTLIIEVELVNTLNIFRDIWISFDIKSLHLIPITTISNYYTGEKIILKPGKNKIKFYIYNFNLKPDNYLISLWGNDKQTGVFDFIDSQIRFKVEETNFYPNGKTPTHTAFGYILFKTEIK